MRQYLKFFSLIIFFCFLLILGKLQKDVAADQRVFLPSISTYYKFVSQSDYRFKGQELSAESYTPSLSDNGGDWEVISHDTNIVQLRLRHESYDLYLNYDGSTGKVNLTDRANIYGTYWKIVRCWRCGKNIVQIRTIFNGKCLSVDERTGNLEMTRMDSDSGTFWISTASK